MTSESLTPSVQTALRLACAQLLAAGCETPRLDAELLLAEALGVDRARLVIDGLEKPDPDGHRRFVELLSRRLAREPMAYILGRRAFRAIELRTDRRALIPRPETELLVEVGLTLPRGVRVLDVGTGSGAVALALKLERPDLAITGTDVSRSALSLARENAAALGLGVAFREADLRGELPCDALIANLPYVEDGAELMPEVGRYEPALALYAGEDGLDLIRRLTLHLDGVAVVALEHGSHHGAVVSRLVRDAGFPAVEVLRDLAGHDRVTVGRR